MPAETRASRPDANPPVLTVRLLGRPCITWETTGCERPLKYRKALALLAWLALPAERWHQRDALAELLWPALAPAAARTNLRQVLKDLRQALNVSAECAPLRIEADLVCLETPPWLWLDVAILEAAEPPASLPDNIDEVFLAGQEWPGLPVFNDWLQSTRKHLSDRAAAVLERMLRERRNAGDGTAALPLARRLHALHPYDEAPAFWLMTLLFEAGEQRAALTFFEHFSTQLQAELGSSPGEALVRLRDGIEAESAGRQPPSVHFDEVRWLSALYCLPAHTDEYPPTPHPQDGMLERAQAVAAQWGGSLLPPMGQGLLLVFGLGAASERTLERALHAASALQSRAGPMRCGVATGRVLVRADGAHPSLMGRPPDLAMQLGWMAQPGETLLLEEASLMAGSDFAFDLLGSRPCPALGAALPLVRLNSHPPPIGQPSQVRNASTQPACGFIGREHILNELLDLWHACRTGSPRIAQVQAAAGLGKTRLSAELAARVHAIGGRVMHQVCRLEWCATPLAPVVELLNRMAGIADIADIADTAPPAGRQHAMRAYLTRTCPDMNETRRTVLLSLLAPGEPQASPPKDAVFDALTELLHTVLHTAPTLLVVDDLHWCDHTTLELLGVLMRGLRTQPVLLLLSGRPGVALACPAEYTRPFELPPLEQTERLALVNALDAAAVLTPTERARIATDCAGVPLFIERMVKCQLEGGHHQQGIDELLQTELWRLGAARQVICAAAVLGERFSLPQLTALLPEAEVRPALNAAQRERLVVTQADGTFRFAHALIRDAAHASLPTEQTRALHLAAAQLLARQEDSAQAVAQHYTQARHWIEAASWWRKAAERAMAAEFVADAQHGFAQALACLQQHGADENQLLMARMRLGRAAQQAQGFGSALAYEHFSTALRSLESWPAEHPERREKLFTALSGRYMGGSSQGAVEGLDIAWHLAALAATPEEKLMTSFALGNSLFWRGQLRAARDWQERGVALAQQIAPQARARFCVDDPAITCRAFLGWTLWFLGDTPGACRVSAEGVALARAGGRVHALCFALTFASGVHWCLGDESMVRRLSAEARTLAQQHGFPLWESVNALFLLWAAARQQQLPDTAPLFNAAAAMRSAYGAGITTSRWITLHALLAHGDAWSQMEALVDTTIAEADINEDQYCLADLLWLKARCLRHRDEPAEARRYRRRARELARKQQALGLLARFRGASSDLPPLRPAHALDPAST